jgi:hypothetical protein
MMELEKDGCMNYLLVQFLIGLDGTFRNGNQLEPVLKF